MQDWYKRAILYELPLAQYRDSNADGIGDFAGATETLDYLANLGVTCIWLPPFLDSPRRDNGYDVRDYYRVDQRFGSAGDMVGFVQAARRRGLRVVMDLPLNHCSCEHPWFQEARRDQDSPYRDYFIWADEPIHRDGDENIVGLDRVWSFDETARQYYHHAFYPHQPDLNLSSVRLREEIKKILQYWLTVGMSGFRFDAVNHMLQPKGRQRFDGDSYRILEELREFVAEHDGEAVLIGETDLTPEGYGRMLGSGNRLHMPLNFYLTNFLFLALARERAAPLHDALQALPAPPAAAVYGNFLRNHDELDLERLSEEERREVLDRFAPKEPMRIYGRGARRRLAPLLGDGARLRLAQSLLLTMPGVPILYYGDEIGMGEDLSRPDRASVRSPMQWSGRAGAGFSDAPEEAWVARPIREGDYGYERRNVAEQWRRSDSLLSWLMRATRARRLCPEFGLGRYRACAVEDERVFAHSCEYRGSSAWALHNLSGDAVEVNPAPLPSGGGAPVEVFADSDYAPVDHGSVRLEPYGFRWFRTGEFLRC